MINGPKYNFSVHQKLFFVVQSKVSIFHRIQPKYNTNDILRKSIHFTATFEKHKKSNFNNICFTLQNMHYKYYSTSIQTAK